jgi:hypothetical protein
MIRVKIQRAGFQHDPFRDGLAQVLAASWPTPSSVRCGLAAVVRERPGKGKADAKGER